MGPVLFLRWTRVSERRAHVETRSLCFFADASRALAWCDVMRSSCKSSIKCQTAARSARRCVSCVCELRGRWCPCGRWGPRRPVTL